MGEDGLERWRRYRTVTAGEPMPCALVDLDALEANTRALAAPLKGSGKTLRVATKSVRCPELVRRILEIAGPVARGLMTYTATETAFWADRGERDLLLAYPVARREDAVLLAAANAGGATAAVVVDCAEHLELLAAAAREGSPIPVVLELDVSWRPLGAAVHIGVRRSPLRDVRDVVALARRAAATAGLKLHGVMAYEAQIAGVADSSPAVRAMKAASGSDVHRVRAAVARALSEAGLKAAVFNGGGTGSLAACAREAALTEVTAGSGFVDSHLFDGYRGLDSEPAAYFALQVVRRPAEGLVTCHGGGYIASGGAGKSRLPVPALPPGLSLLPLEGAGEVQTPLQLGRGGQLYGHLGLGDPVFFRHAKAGELAEHFAEYLLVRGDRIEGRAPTYRDGQMLSRLKVLVFVLPVAASCAAPRAYPTNTVGMRFDRTTSFYDAPFPSDDLRNLDDGGDGSVNIAGFPNLPAPDTVDIISQMTAMLAADAHGFAEEGAIFFTLGGAAHPVNLPDMATSVTPAASVFLLGVDPTAPDYLHRYPITVRFDVDGGPFGAPNLLTLLPLQGAPLRPGTMYAAVITTATGLQASDEMAAIASGIRLPSLGETAFGEYWAALGSLEQAGIAKTDVAGLSVFKTDDPTAALGKVVADMLASHVPAPDAAFQQTDLFDDYCVYASTLPMPDYQSGDAPYDFHSTGGGWTFRPDGTPIFQRNEEAGMVVTIPRAPMPAAGWPIAHLIRTGAGGSRPLVDRGPQATNGGPPIVPGSGPARQFAKAGMAGASVDGPHEDLRNLTNDNEDYLMFNINNAYALRDNVRESAAEYAVFAHVLAALSFDVSDCPGTTGPARFDASKMALMGHSMGSTISPLVMSVEPMYRALVMSGAGGSWIENIIWKQLPLSVRPVVDLLLRYNQLDPPRDIQEDDPVLTLLQWSVEPADPLVYTRTLVQEPPAGMAPRQVLMEQGIVDHYIMPPIANATSLSLGLDLTGTPLDASSAELVSDGTPTLESVLQYSGRQQLRAPVAGNYPGGLTAVVVQHPSDGIEDGHEMVFQTDPPKREYRCFLQTWVAGQTPLVPLPGDVNGACE